MRRVTHRRGVDAEELGQAGAVRRVLNDSQLDGAPKLLPEGGILLALLAALAGLLILRAFCKQVLHTEGTIVRR